MYFDAYNIRNNSAVTIQEFCPLSLHNSLMLQMLAKILKTDVCGQTSVPIHLNRRTLSQSYFVLTTSGGAAKPRDTGVTPIH